MATVKIFTFCDIKPKESFFRCLLLWVAVCWAACVTGRLRIWIGHWLTGLFSAADSKLLTTALKQMGAITNISQFSSSCSVWVNAAVIHGSRDREIRNTITPNLNLSSFVSRSSQVWWWVTGLTRTCPSPEKHTAGVFMGSTNLSLSPHFSS